MLPEPSRGWYRCLMFNCAFNSHLFSVFWPVRSLCSHHWASLIKAYRNTVLWAYIWLFRRHLIGTCPYRTITSMASTGTYNLPNHKLLPGFTVSNVNPPPHPMKQASNPRRKLTVTYTIASVSSSCLAGWYCCRYCCIHVSQLSKTILPQQPA